MKKHIKLLLRTLFSNNACVEAARTKETKYNIIAIVFVLFSLFFAAMPTCVTGFQQMGGNCIRGTSFGFDTGMQEFKDKANDGTQVTLKLTENQYHLHCLDNSDGAQNAWNARFTESTTEYLTTDPHRFVSVSAAEDQHKLLEIYVCWSDKDADFNKYVSNVLNNINPLSNGKDEKGNWLDHTTGDKPAKKTRSTSFIVFGHHCVQAVIYQPGNTSPASSVFGDYQNTPIKAGGIDLISEVLVKSDTPNPSKIIQDCALFFDQVYVNPRRANTWRSTGIILGVDGGVIILMGFMVWILTRGKNNPFRIYSFWDGQKIAYYASLTPGILALFGFLMSNMAMMLFILAAGVRIMWLSMRTLRYQAPAKQ